MSLKYFISKYRSMPVQVKASLWFVVCSFAQKGISLITTPIFTRLLTTYEYGKYSVFSSWLNLLTIVITLDICEGVFSQGLIKFEEDRRVFASSLQGLTMCLCLGWLIIYLLFQDIFNSVLSLTTSQVLIMFGMIWTSTVYNFWAVYERVQYKYIKLVILTLLVSVAKPFISIIFIYWLEDNFMARLLGLLMAQVIYGVLFFKQISIGKIFFHKKYWLYVLKFNILLLPHYLSTSVINGADRIMIEKIVGVGEAGIYGLAYSVALILSILNSALFQTLTPWLYKKIKENDFEKIPQIAYPTIILIAGVNILLILFAPEVIHFFAPKEYYNAIYIIPPITMSVFFMFIYGYFSCFEFYYEKTHYISLSTVIGALLNIILNYMFIRKYGYYAAGYTTLFCYMLFALFHYYFMRKICNEYLEGIQVYDTKRLLQIIISFLSIGFSVAFIYPYFYIRYILIGIFVVVSILCRKKIYKIIKKILTINEAGVKEL